MSGPAYDTVLALHVVTGFVGFGALGISGYWAGRARTSPEDPAVNRYFRQGTNWAARAIYLVPLAGLALTAMAGDPAGEARSGWMIAGIAGWCAAAGLAAAFIWPAEREVQKVMAAMETASMAEPNTAAVPDPTLGAAADFPALRAACRKVSHAAAAADVIYVAVVVLMVAKP